MTGNEMTNDCDGLVREFSKGAFVWYGFKPSCTILYIYTDVVDVAVKEFLEEKGMVISCLCNELICKEKTLEDKYDYIVGIDVIEKCSDSQRLLNVCRKLLKNTGKVIIGTENRYALKYICGDRDPYTNHNFDGIENYRRLSSKDIKNRCYSMAELKDMFKTAGFNKEKFYSVMPSLQETQLVYAEGYEPVEELSMRYSPIYNHPESVFLQEQYLYTDLIKNGMFHKMANAYIIEAGIDENYDETIHATISLDRGRENALVTSICMHDGIKRVYKKAVYEQGAKKIKDIYQNLNNLKNRGINVANCKIDRNTFIMPYIDAPIAMIELKKIAKRDVHEFFNALDVMYELILNSSEHTDTITEKDKNSANGRSLGPILSKGYIDMVPLNCFYDNRQKNPKDRYIYYDQEFYWENCPAKAIMYRAITIIYDGMDKEFEGIIPQKVLFERYGLTECIDIWSRMSYRFIDQLRNQKGLRTYYEKKKIDTRVLYTNREKINYSVEEYQRIFVDIFEDYDNNNKHKKLILFGSGKFMKHFLFQFGKEYSIYSIIDNNSDKWGENIEGIPINSPDILKDIPSDEIHIIICIKGYSGVVNQLETMGIKEYHIYNPGNDYPNKRRKQIANRCLDNNHIEGKIAKEDKKIYNVGYIAGVFDLFHIGHLNMFKKAKAQCKYLMVGVVSDEGVRLNKQAEPYIPFEERVEIVRSCRYVDEVIKLPLDYCGTRDIFNLYHFDVQFSGSDYENDNYWLAEKEWLEKHGATMVFFPYTQSTSSTKLKKAINDKIQN